MSLYHESVVLYDNDVTDVVSLLNTSFSRLLTVTFTKESICLTCF